MEVHLKTSLKAPLKRLASAAAKPLAALNTKPSLERPLQMLLSFQYRDKIIKNNEHLDFEQAGFNAYSSTYEDGILLFIFSIIGTVTKKCVDIGAGSIQGSNTANLIVNHGFSGLGIEGNSTNVEISRNWYATRRETKLFPPTLVTALVTAENINQLLSENGFQGAIDLLCIDIDGIDYWIWKAIDRVDPRVVVVEYQDILGPDRAWTVPYKPDFNANDHAVNKTHKNYCGASLRAFTQLAAHKGYRLVGVNRGGWNAFFVKNGIGEQYLPAVSVESCFKYEWNRLGIDQRFPLVKDMPWEEV